MDENMILVSKQYKKRSQGAEIWRRIRKNRGAMLGLFLVIMIVLIAVFSGVFMDYETDVIGQNISQRLQHPSLAHPMGTDDVGRDVMSRLLYGTRYSLSVGVVAVIIALIFGVTLGSVAGFFGGKIEEVIMRASDMLAAVPSILMAIAIVGSGTEHIEPDAGCGDHQRAAVCPNYQGGCAHGTKPGIHRSLPVHRAE